MREFINPFSDWGFKHIFGREVNKDLLIDFLNNLLKGEREIVDLTFLDKEQLSVQEAGRSLIYDIYCKTTDGETIIVEMQNQSQWSFKKRSIYYVAESIVKQGERGADWNYEINSVYLVAFLNFRSDSIGSEFRTDVALMNCCTKEVFSDAVRLIYLQLPLFCKEVEECENDFERWIYILKNMDALKKLPWLAESETFRKLLEISEVSALNEDERRQYEAALRYYRDTVSVMKGQWGEGHAFGLEEGLEKGHAYGLAEGLAKGLAKGMARGIEKGKSEGRSEGMAEGMERGLERGKSEERRSMIRMMHANGMTVDDISRVLGMSVSDVEGFLVGE